MNGCTYNAQGFIMCPTPAKKEGFSFFEQFTNKCPKEVPINDVFKNWSEPGNDDASHIWNACDKTSCTTKGCSSCGSSGRTCTVSCKKCSYCKGNTWFPGDKAVTQTQNAVTVTGPKAVKALYFCGDGKIVDRQGGCGKNAIDNKLTQSKCGKPSQQTSPKTTQEAIKSKYMNWWM